MKYKFLIENKYLILVDAIDKGEKFSLLLMNFLKSNMFNMNGIKFEYDHKYQYDDGSFCYGEGVYYRFQETGVYIWDWEEDMNEGIFIEYDDLFKIAKRYFEQPKDKELGYVKISDEVYDTETEPMVDINMY